MDEPKVTGQFTKSDWIEVGKTVEHSTIQKQIISDHLKREISDLVVVSSTLSPYQRLIQMVVLEPFLAKEGWIEDRKLLISGEYREGLSPFEYTDVEVEPEKFVKIPDRGFFLLHRDTERMVVHLEEWGYKRFKLYVYCPREDSELGMKFLNGLAEYAKQNNILRGKKITIDLTHVKLNDSYNWESVILPDETKKEIVRNVDLLVGSIDVYKKNGMTFKRGLILKGPPGTGKTTIAKVICKTLTGATFIWVTPGDLDRAEKVKVISELARELSPAVLFLEDIDLYGGHREQVNKGILGELMNQLDGLVENEFVIVIATTNRADDLEEAIRNRPGRFDRSIDIPIPDDGCRKRMFESFLSKIQVNVKDREKFLVALVESTKDFTGAHVKELVNSAIISAIDQKSLDQDGKVILEVEHFRENLDRVRSKKMQPGMGFIRSDSDSNVPIFPEDDEF